ncbi:MAG: flagellar biosynthesis anti-sigma factor FlgM [Phycisphaerae bacterium]|nr:flagellar biosynthesis anti-sigma factor FlgM [Phycisphaerae bacterium]
MNEVGPINSVVQHEVGRARAEARRGVAAMASPERDDRVEISSAARALSETDRADVRADKVAQIRAAIERGDYETDEKLDVTIDRLLSELGS